VHFIFVEKELRINSRQNFINSENYSANYLFFFSQNVRNYAEFNWSALFPWKSSFITVIETFPGDGEALKVACYRCMVRHYILHISIDLKPTSAIATLKACRICNASYAGVSGSNSEYLSLSVFCVWSASNVRPTLCFWSRCTPFCWYHLSHLSARIRITNPPHGPCHSSGG
jgi:hypothetical protein